MEWLKKYWLNLLNISASLCSIASILLLLFADKDKALLALVFVVIFLSAVLVVIIVGIFRFTKKENVEDFKIVTIFASYETFDKSKAEYNVYKVIQSKVACLTTVKQQFKWTGTNQPELSSDFQDIKKINVLNDEEAYDNVILGIRNPILYNGTTTIHLKAKLDDYDGKSKPLLSQRIEFPVVLARLRVVLRDKSDSFDKVAYLEKRKIKCSPLTSDYKIVESISFDKASKSYSYNLINPEVGYIYRIRWEK